MRDVALTDDDFRLRQLAQSMAAFGVLALPCWMVQEHGHVVPGVNIGGDLYLSSGSLVGDDGVDWATVVATLARGVRA